MTGVMGGERDRGHFCRAQPQPTLLAVTSLLEEYPMRFWNRFTIAAVVAITLLGTEACRPVKAGELADKTAQPGQVAFEAIKRLVGKWQAPMAGNKTMVDTFQPFAFGSAILAEEWLDGEQITSTVFYMVGSELRADHYCDYLNQPRYVAKASADPSIINFEFREATNLDAHPAHFHGTRWHLTDATHMTQEWDVEGSKKGKSTIALNFVRQQ